MANQPKQQSVPGFSVSSAHWTRQLGGLAAAAAILACGSIHAAPAESAGGFLYRSTMADGSIVFSDRQLDGARSSTRIARSVSPDSGEVARRERDYWRQRAEAFSERARARERDLEETKRALMVAERMNRGHGQQQANETIVYLPAVTFVGVGRGGYHHQEPQRPAPIVPPSPAPNRFTR